MIKYFFTLFGLLAVWNCIFLNMRQNLHLFILADSLIQSDLQFLYVRRCTARKIHCHQNFGGRWESWALYFINHVSVLILQYRVEK